MNFVSIVVDHQLVVTGPHQLMQTNKIAQKKKSLCVSNVVTILVLAENDGHGISDNDSCPVPTEEGVFEDEDDYD